MRSIRTGLLVFPQFRHHYRPTRKSGRTIRVRSGSKGSKTAQSINTLENQANIRQLSANEYCCTPRIISSHRKHTIHTVRRSALGPTTQDSASRKRRRPMRTFALPPRLFTNFSRPPIRHFSPFPAEGGAAFLHIAACCPVDDDAGDSGPTNPQQGPRTCQ